jgi:hypothetical protein
MWRDWLRDAPYRILIRHMGLQILQLLPVIARVGKEGCVKTDVTREGYVRAPCIDDQLESIVTRLG